VPAISSEERTAANGAADADLLVPADVRQLDRASPDSLKEAAVLLASFAKMLTSDPARGAIGQAARADLVCKLEALESRLRDYADAGAWPVEAMPASREANIPSGSLGEKESGTLSRFSALPKRDVERGTPDALLQQIEAAHARLSAQLQAGFAAATAEMTALSTTVSSAIEKVGSPSGADQIHEVRAALEQVSQALTQRLDLAASGLAPLSAIETSIRELSARLEEMRQTSASMSAPDTRARSGTAEQAVLDAIAGLRALHEETANRAALAWGSIQSSLDQVASLCGRLEAAAAHEPAERPTNESDPSDPFLSLLARFAPRGGSPQPKGIGSATGGVNASAQASATHGPCEADKSGDFGEFGPANPKDHRAPQAAPPLQASQESEGGPSRGDFLAAARRAAKTARLEGQGNRPSTEGGTGAGEGFSSLFRHGERLFHTYRRQMFVGAAIMFTLIVTVALGRLFMPGKAGDFLPTFFRQFHNQLGGQSPASAGTAANKTAAIQPSYPGSPQPMSLTGVSSNTGTDISSNTGAPRNNSTPSTAPVAAASRDPLTPQAIVPSAGRHGGAAAQAISGSDAIVAAELQPAKPKPGSGQGPAAAPTTLPPAPKAQSALPVSGSGGASTSIVADSPPRGSAGDLLARAQTGDPEAQFELAAHYAEDSAATGKLALAAQWYEKAAQQGHAVAEYRLASLYEKGRGVAKDIERAKDLYQRAAEKGNIRAMHNLGVLAAEGTDGKPNYTSAALWFSKAAEYGVKDSQYNFAVLLARGLGVTKDLVRSYTWFAIVAASGDADAGRKRDEVAARLTSSELSSANASAAAFVPKTPDWAANEPVPVPSGQEAAKANAGPVKSKVSGL
jgi:localization factor PodJL